MKTFALTCAALLAVALAQSEEKYSRRYDNIDVNTIFRSSRLLNNYVDCLLDKKPCPPEGKDLKRKFIRSSPRF
jgi:Insect pheromone-binding family, A10/OS-D